MPRLDWSTLPETQVKIREESELVSLMNRQPSLRLELELMSEQWARLGAELGRLFSDEADPDYLTRAEIKVELPLGWTLYFKTRDGDSRMLMAHPERDQWVASISLNPTHGRALVQAVHAHSPGSTFVVDSLQEMGTWSNTSNFALSLTWVAAGTA